MNSGGVDANVLPRPGDVLADRYVLECIVGFGSMSVVFGARHRVTGKRCAIKLLLPDERGGSAAASDAREGARKLVGHFQHPNMLDVHDVGQAAGTFYTVLDWMDGESLAARLARVGTLSLRDVHTLLIPCMRGMHEAHAAGIVHSELSPASIYICRPSPRGPEVAKVLDFGVATFQDPDAALRAATKCLPGAREDAPTYHAPEQRLGLPADRRADIYAFGAIVYQALSGELPRAAYAQDERLVFIEPPPLPERAPGMSTAGAIARRAMASELSARFQSLADLADALEACCNPRPRLPAEGHAPQARRSTPPTSATGGTPRSSAVFPSAPSTALPRSNRGWLYLAAAFGVLSAAAMSWPEPESSDVIATFEAVASPPARKPAEAVAHAPQPSAAAIAAPALPPVPQPAAPVPDAPRAAAESTATPAQPVRAPEPVAPAPDPVAPAAALAAAEPARAPAPNAPPEAALASENRVRRPVVRLPFMPPPVLRARPPVPSRSSRVERPIETPRASLQPLTTASEDGMEMKLF